MTAHDMLTLDVGAFELRGSYGEAAWGSPVAVEIHPRISEWVFGMREGGGGGYVLLHHFLP